MLETNSQINPARIYASSLLASLYEREVIPLFCKEGLAEI
jgi:hypothetical protein